MNDILQVAAMKTAAKQMKIENKKLNINEIEDMQDDMTDLFEDMQEINDIMGRAYNCPAGLDEADLDAELACLGRLLFGCVECLLSCKCSVYM